MRAATSLRLAARNVLRNRSRSALTLGALFFGVAMTVLLAGFGNGLGVLMTNDFVNAKVGGLRVQRKGYADQRDNQPLKLNLAQGGAFEDKLRAVPGVAAVAPRLVFSGLVSNGNDATMFIGRGIDPDREYVVLPWARRDIEGQPIRADAPGRAVVGVELAQALKAPIGGTLIVQATTLGGQQNALDLEVGGTLAEASAFEVKRVVHVPLAFAQSLLRMPGKVSAYTIRVSEGADVDQVGDRLRAALGPEYEVETWRQILPNLAAVITFQRVIMGVISTVFLIIVVFGVANTMAMSVFERTREIGTMMALGLRRERIGLLLVLEAALLATAGATAGAAVARAIVALLAQGGGFAFRAPGSTVARYNLIPVVPPFIMGLAVLGSITGALLAAAYPAWKATRLRPVDALRAL
jgi:putative ABC transport system permease protein